MKIKLHHLNLCSKDVAGMEAFYRSVLDLAPEPSLNSARDTTQGYAAPVAFVTDGQTQVHLATTDLGVGFRANHIVKSRFCVLCIVHITFLYSQVHCPP